MTSSHHPSTVENLPTRGQSQVVFVQLDPILKQLLPLVTDFRQMSESLTSKDDLEGVVTEAWVSNIQQQIQCLGRLQKAIQQLGHVFAPSLVVMADYVSLPLTAIFAISERCWNERNNQMATSHVRNLLVATAECIKVYVQTIHPSDKSPSTTTTVPTVLLSSKHCIQFLVALTRGIPRTVNTNDSSTKSNKQTSLDDGSNTLIAIFHAMLPLIESFPGDLHTVLEGGLVVRLVDCATTVIAEGANNSRVLSMVVRIEAAKVLQSLLQNIAHAETWQAMFPGVLVALYRCTVSLRHDASTGQSIQLQCTCLQCIRQLLSISLLGPSSAQENATAAKSIDSTTNVANMMQNLQLLAQKANASTRANTTSSTTKSLANNNNNNNESSSTNFISLVQQRAVTPLLILMKQAMASKSVRVRLEAIQLCRVVLVETSHCWNGTSLPEAALECGLILQNDMGDEQVAEAAKAMLEDHLRAELNCNSTHSANWISKIRSLMEELPILSQGGKTLELKMQLQLLKGYIEAVLRLNQSNNNNNNNSGSSKTDNRKELTISSSTFSFQPLIQLMEVDASATCQPTRPLPVKDSSRGECFEIQHYQSKLPIRRLNLENAKLAGNVLEALGRAMGPKQGAFTVDALLVDMLDAWTTRGDKPNLTILLEWAGRIVVATKILIGSFSPLATETAKDQKRRRKILVSLASSILPMLVEPNIRAWTNGQVPPSPQIREGIAAVLILSLEFQAVTTSLLEQDAEDLIGLLLYPSAERAHSGNNSVVQQAARETIGSLASSCGLSRLGFFLERESAHLFAEMLSRLRIPGGAITPQEGEVFETLGVVLCLTWTLNEIADARSDDGAIRPSMAGVSSLIELANTLMDRLDFFHLDRAISEEDTMRLTKLYSSLFRYLMVVFEETRKDESNLNSTDDNPSIGLLGEGSWLELLRAFHKAPADGFHEENDGDGNDPADVPESKPAQALNEDGEMEKTKAAIQLSSNAIFRACYLLSNSSLRVQISACETLSLGFQFLALCSKKDRGGEDADIRNAVFRQVATSWPSIKARLSKIVDYVVETYRAIPSLLIVSQSQQSEGAKRDVATQRFFLSRLLQLVADIFYCSGDFMADRFKASVWPILAKQFQHMMESQVEMQQGPTKGRMIQEVGQSQRGLITDQTTTVRDWSDSERHLLLSMLQCLERVFGSEESRGTCLVRIHYEVGLVLLPFVGDPDDEISQRAVGAIKNIVAQDCDVLFRPLLETSGRGIPPCPIEIPGLSDGILIQYATGAGKATGTPTKLAAGCEEILCYIDTLPEQEL